MKTQEELLHEFLGILSKTGILNHVVLIGSWAEYAYEKTSYLAGYQSMMKTLDMDFYLPNKSRPPHATNLIQELKANDYVLDQSLQGYSLIEKDGMSIEFLIQEKGAGSSQPYKLDNLGLKVVGLRFLNILSDNSTKIHLEGFEISVPYPAAYALHKLLINERRSEQKKEKDILAVKNIMQHIYDDPTEKKRFSEIYSGLPIKARKSIEITAAANKIRLPVITKEKSIDHER